MSSTDKAASFSRGDKTDKTKLYSFAVVGTKPATAGEYNIGLAHGVIDADSEDEAKRVVLEQFIDAYPNHKILTFSVKTVDSALDNYRGEWPEEFGRRSH